MPEIQYLMFSVISRSWEIQHEKEISECESYPLDLESSGGKSGRSTQSPRSQPSMWSAHTKIHGYHMAEYFVGSSGRFRGVLVVIGRPGFARFKYKYPGLNLNERQV